MNEPPPGWLQTTVGEICEKPQYGWTTKADPRGSGLRLLRTTDITSGRIDWSTVPFCTTEPPDAEKYVLVENDIVVSRAGSVGASIRVTSPQPAVFASYLIRLRAVDGVDTGFLAWFLKSPGYWAQIADVAAGIALQNVNAKKLAAIRLPLPPLNEQRRIVAAIEEHLSRLDALEATIETIVGRFERGRGRVGALRRSILIRAFTGQLVPQNPSDEPASVLLDRIRAERAAAVPPSSRRRATRQTAP